MTTTTQPTNFGTVRPELLTPAEVAQLFAVDPKTVTRWTKAGKLPIATRTLGGHRRYARDVVEALLEKAQGATT